MTDITPQFAPRTIARYLDQLGVEYHPADLASREVRDPANQPQDIQLLPSGARLSRDDDGWSYTLPGQVSRRSLETTRQLPAIAAGQRLTRDAYLCTTVHAWSGRGVERVEIWLEADGTVLVDQSTGWATDWTSCHDISPEDQQRIRKAAEAAAKRRGQNGGILGDVVLGQ